MSSASTIVVSGAGTGIGRAVARKLAADGCHVTAVGRRMEPLEQLAAQAGKQIGVIAADVSTDLGAITVATEVASAGLACAGVVSAAGGIGGAAVADADRLKGVRLDWQSSFESNVLTAVLLTEALREQLEQNGGRVVLISSVAALRGSGGGPYGAMKAALHGWVYDLAAELGPHGGTANVVAPGFVPDTEFWAGRLNRRVPAAPGGSDSRRQGRRAGGDRIPDRVASWPRRWLGDRSDPLAQRRSRSRQVTYAGIGLPGDHA